MKPETRTYLAQLATPYLRDDIEGPYVLGEVALPDRHHGVYIVYDVRERCAYVGKVCSELDSDRLRARIDEHRREPRKLNAFNSVYFVPVLPSAPCGLVERIEGLVAQHLQPYLGRRRPDPRRRTRIVPQPRPNADNGRRY